MLRSLLPKTRVVTFALLSLLAKCLARRRGAFRILHQLLRLSHFGFLLDREKLVLEILFRRYHFFCHFKHTAESFGTQAHLEHTQHRLRLERCRHVKQDQKRLDDLLVLETCHLS